ncbi:hypothetical protein [Methanobacterium oryzae]|uniref:hypothetical protein n=1 Tax=Methanobacterium oryzae TaxID=69540 RepID=UPI003D1E6D57
MISPKVYHQQIDDLDIEGMLVFADTADEASILLNKLEKMEEILEKIRVNVRMDIRNIRREYMDKIKLLESDHETSRKYKLKEKKNLIEEREINIAPYEAIEILVEDYLRQIRDAQIYVNNIIHESI